MVRLGIGIAAMTSVFLGCGDDSSPAASDSTSTATTDAPPSSGGSTAQPASTSDGPTSSGEPDETTTSQASTSGATTSGTTSDDSYFCNGWDERATRPFLEVYSDSAMETPMASGGTWPLICGGQGTWMFAVYPAMGGFAPVGGMVNFAVDIQVEGFSGPGGQFHLSPMYPYDVECSSGGETFDGGFNHDCIAILPPDKYFEDLSVLDGAVATVRVDLLDPEGNSVASVDFTDVVLSAPVRPGPDDFCF